MFATTPLPVPSHVQRHVSLFSGGYCLIKIRYYKQGQQIAFSSVFVLLSSVLLSSNISALLVSFLIIFVSISYSFVVIPPGHVAVVAVTK